jgi:transcription antitermination factor NusG
MEEQQHVEIKKIDGIINFVYWLRKPAIIRNDEIETIKRFLNDYSNVHLEKFLIHVNDRVTVLNGPLMNKEGDVLEVNNKSVKVLLPSLGYMMVAYIEKQNVKIIRNNSFADYATL